MRFLRNLYDAKKDHCSRIRTPQESRKGFSRLRSTKNFLVDALRSRTYMASLEKVKFVMLQIFMLLVLERVVYLSVTLSS